MSTFAETRSPSRRVAVLLVLGVVALIGWGLIAGSTIPEGTVSSGSAAGAVETDEDLYRAINDRMADGDGYYEAAIREQVARGYPTAPAVSVRPPTFAWTVDLLGEAGARILMGVVLIGAAVLALQRFETITASRAERYVAVLLVVFSTLVYLAPNPFWTHEAWAVGFTLLAILLWRDDRWWPAVVLGSLAPFFRELAVVFPIVMLGLALLGRRRREAIGWAAGLVLFAAFFAWHVSQVAAHQVPDPPRSQGWLELGGWPFIVDSMTYSSFASGVPYVVIAVLAPLALAGLCFVRSTVVTTMLVTSLVYIACFMVVGRPANTYWGVLYAALLMPGLAFVPRGAAATWRALRGG